MAVEAISNIKMTEEAFEDVLKSAEELAAPDRRDELAVRVLDPDWVFRRKAWLQAIDSLRTVPSFAAISKEEAAEIASKAVSLGLTALKPDEAELLVSRPELLAQVHVAAAAAAEATKSPDSPWGAALARLLSVKSKSKSEMERAPVVAGTVSAAPSGLGLESPSLSQSGLESVRAAKQWLAEKWTAVLGPPVSLVLAGTVNCPEGHSRPFSLTPAQGDVKVTEKDAVKGKIVAWHRQLNDGARGSWTFQVVFRNEDNATGGLEWLHRRTLQLDILNREDQSLDSTRVRLRLMDLGVFSTQGVIKQDFSNKNDYTFRITIEPSLGENVTATSASAWREAQADDDEFSGS